MKLAFALVLSVTAMVSVYAQNYAVIKPLENDLETTKDPAKRAKIHLDLLKEYEIFDVEKSLEHGLAAWNEASKDSLKKEMATAANRLGAIYQFDGNDADLAIQWHIRALKLAEEIKDSALIADCSYNLGQLLADNGDDDRAFGYFETSSRIAAAKNDYTMLVMSEVAYGNKQKLKEQKFKHYQNALEAAGHLQGDTISLAQAWSTMGDYYREIKEEEQSKYWYEKVFQLLHGRILHSSDHYLLELFATACLRTERYDESIQVAGRIVGLRNSAGSSDWYSVEGMKLLAEGYYYNGYDSLAFWTAMDYAAKKDSIQDVRNSSQTQKNVQKWQGEFDNQRREQQLRLLQEKTKYERFFGYLLAGGLIFIIFIAAYLYRERQKAFNRNKQLARINQTKDKLLSIISHDVRSPIQALQNIISLFEQDIATREDVYTVTKHVNASVQAMAQGLDNLFYWAQSQQQELKSYPESFNLSDLVTNLIDLFSERLRKKELTVQYNLREPVYMVSDLLHTRLIISNVLVNAIKFSPLKGVIKIDFNIDAEGNGVLSVSDSGKGIPEEDIAKIFDPSIRYTRPGTAEEPGSGLGLSLTRDLLLLDNNEISIISFPGKGTRIDLIFRRKKSPI